jgi:hypothetical protein
MIQPACDISGYGDDRHPGSADASVDSADRDMRMIVVSGFAPVCMLVTLGDMQRECGRDARFRALADNLSRTGTDQDGCRARRRGRFPSQP